MKLNRIIPSLSVLAALVALVVWRFGMNHQPSSVPPVNLAVEELTSEKNYSSNPASAPDVANLAPMASPDLPRSQLLRSMLTAIESVHSVADPLRKTERLQKIAAQVAAADLPEVIDFLWHKQYLSSTGEELRSLLIQRWAELNPKAAADWVARQAGGSVQSDALKLIATAWANVNLSDAVAWARRLPENGTQQETLAKIAYETVRTLPVEAMTLAVELPVGSTRDDLLAHIAPAWAAEDPQAAIDWTKKIEDKDLREHLLASMTASLAEKNPQDAAQLVLDSISPGRKQDDAIVTLVSTWVQSEPELVAQWVTEFPQGKLQETAIESLVPLWADKNLDQVTNWVTGLPFGATRDIAIGALVSKLLPQSPKTAAEWVLKITDPERRQRETENVRAWLD